jgi:hypothetical protein
VLLEVSLQASAINSQSPGEGFLGRTAGDGLLIKGLQPFGKLQPELLIFLGPFHKKTLDGRS